MISKKETYGQHAAIVVPRLRRRRNRRLLTAGSYIRSMVTCMCPYGCRSAELLAGVDFTGALRQGAV